MLTPQALLADTIELSKVNLSRYLVGFDDASSTRQAANLPNHIRWNIGHLALTMHRVAEKVDGKPIPDSDFASTPAKGKFNTESVSFGSKPADDELSYPPLERCVEIYNAAVDRLAAAARALPDSRLTEMVPWPTLQMPMHQLIVRMAYHNGFHIGQIADMRRALGFKSIFA